MSTLRTGNKDIAEDKLRAKKQKLGESVEDYKTMIDLMIDWDDALTTVKINFYIQYVQGK